MKSVIEAVAENVNKYGEWQIDMKVLIEETGLSLNRVYAKLSEALERKDIAIFKRNGIDFLSIQNKALMR